MKPGLPKKYAKMGFKKGWKEFKKTKAYTGKSKSKSKSKSTGGTRTMTKGGFNTNKIFGAIRKIAIFIPAIHIATQPWTMADKLTIGQRWYFGWDNRTNSFSWSELMNGWGPAFGAQVVTRIPALINKVLGMFR